MNHDQDPFDDKGYGYFGGRTSMDDLYETLTPFVDKATKFTVIIVCVLLAALFIV